MSLDPKIWGRAMWTSLLTVALGYPVKPKVDDIYHYKRWYYHLQYVLPCETCRKNFNEHIRRIPIDHFLKSRRALIHWVTRMHNEVSREHGKAPLTPREMLQKYVREHNQDGGGFEIDFRMLIIVALSAFIIYKYVLPGN